MNIASSNYADTRVAHYANRASFPTTGSALQLYFAEDTSDIWCWYGTAYKKITGTLPAAPANGDVNDMVSLRASYDSTGALIGYSWVKTKITDVTGV